MKKFAQALFAVIFLLALSILPTQAHAMTTSSGQTVTVSKDQTISGTLFAGGNTVTIDGTVNGDLFCGGQNIFIAGSVTGDVICAGQNIRIDGTVGGNLRLAGQNLDVSGKVKRNITALGQTLILDKTATVTGEVIFAGKDLKNDAGAGAVTFIKPKQEKKAQAWKLPKPTPLGPLGIVWRIIGYVVLGVIVTALAPKWTRKVMDYMRDDPWPSIGSGCLVLIVVPVLLVTLMITIIGIPIAVLALLAFFLAIAISRILAALLAGSFILDNLHLNKDKNMLVAILVGVPVTWLVFSIPVFGWFAGFVAVLWGLGAILLSRKSKH